MQRFVRFSQQERALFLYNQREILIEQRKRLFERQEQFEEERKHLLARQSELAKNAQTFSPN